MWIPVPHHLRLQGPLPSSRSKKKKSGTHSQGIAADIAVADASQRRILVAQALRLGFNGVGVARGFIHVDTRETTPVLWLYH